MIFFVTYFIDTNHNNNQIENDGSSSPTSETSKRRSLKPSTSTSSNGLNLAAELNLASVGTSDWEATQKANETDQTIRSK